MRRPGLTGAGEAGDCDSATAVATNRSSISLLWVGLPVPNRTDADTVHERNHKRHNRIRIWEWTRLELGRPPEVGVEQLALICLMDPDDPPSRARQALVLACALQRLASQ